MKSVCVLTILFLQLFCRLEIFKIKSSSGSNPFVCSMESQKAECESVGRMLREWISAQCEKGFCDIAGQRWNRPHVREYWQGKDRLENIHTCLQVYAHSIANKYLLRGPNPGYKRKQRKFPALWSMEQPLFCTYTPNLLELVYCKVRIQVFIVLLTGSVLVLLRVFRKYFIL